MALDVRASFTTSKNLFTRLVRQSDSLHWDDVGTVWGAVNDANNRIAMTEGPFDGRYAATVTGLGEDQWVEVYVEESTDPDPAIGPVETIGVEQVYIVAGNEAPIPAPGAAVRSTKIVADERTWRLQSNSTGHIATNVIKLVPAGAATSTVAMDFSEMLNPETALLSVSSAVEVTAFSLGLERQKFQTICNRCTLRSLLLAPARRIKSRLRWQPRTVTRLAE